MRISEIKVGERYRKKLGDLTDLAESMQRLGLLHPIGVTPGGHLVFGERRLRAAQSLGWEEIAARVVDVDALIAERDENFARLDFTPSEKVSIAAAIQARIGSRQGQRTDQQHVEDVPQVPPGQKTRQHAAKAAGFGNETTYRQARKVVEEGTPELREAMDDGVVAVSAAARIAKLPEEQQKQAIEKVKTGEARNGTAAVQQVKREARQEERAQAKPVSSLRYEVLQGSAPEVLAGLPERSVRCVVTDPPYGLETHRTREGGRDYADGEKYALNLLRDTSRELARVCLAGAHLYVFSGYSYAWDFKQILSQHFEVNDNPLVWVKNRQTIAYPESAKFASKYELIWFCRAPGEVVGLNEHATDVLEYNAVSSAHSTGHSAEKPVELLRHLVRLSTARGELVCDPFAGSGATGEAASLEDRAFVGVELDPKWAEVARGRAA